MTDTIGDRVRKLRKSHALTQKEFGDSISIAHSSVCLLERDKLGRIDRTLNDICKEYNVNKEWLLTGQGSIYAENESFIHPELELELKKTPSLLETTEIVAKHMTKKDWQELNKFMEEEV